MGWVSTLSCRRLKSTLSCCGGVSTGSFIFGDVVLVTAACDFELGHNTGRGELEDAESEHTWFPLDSLSDYSVEQLNAELYDKVYPMIRDLSAAYNGNDKTCPCR